MSTTERVNRQMFAHHLALARRHGWSVPDPDHDSHGPAAWLGYWGAMENTRQARERGEKPGHPVVPHTPGQRGPEDHFQRAERINRNRALWEGYL